jgi:hypothetical protein
MQHTIAAVFDSSARARQARDALLAQGFDSAKVSLNEADAGAGKGGATAAPQDELSIGSTIKHLFSDLFGRDRAEDARMYADAVAAGHCVLTITGQEEDQAERAADILERYGPLQIEEDEQARQWSGGAPQKSMQGSASQQGAGPAAAAPARKSGAGQPLRGAVRIFSQLRKTTSDDTEQLEVEIMQVSPSDEIYYREHWSSTVNIGDGNFDEYFPAYRYGSTMAGSKEYQGRSWDEAEPDLKRKWELAHPKSAWEKMKAAIRHGWERITS